MAALISAQVGRWLGGESTSTSALTSTETAAQTASSPSLLLQLPLPLSLPSSVNAINSPHARFVQNIAFALYSSLFKELPPQYDLNPASRPPLSPHYRFPPLPAFSNTVPNNADNNLTEQDHSIALEHLMLGSFAA